MNNRERQSLDRYITGNYGEDQIRSEFWPVPSVHQEFCQRYLLHDVYEYDPTDDGPEVEIITRILESHPTLDPVVAAFIRLALDAQASFDFALKMGVVKV